MSAAYYVDKVKGHLATYDRELSLDRYELLNTAHEKTGQPRIYLVLGAVGVTLILVSAVLGLAFVSNLFAFYPLYNSFKALRSGSPADDQFWLTYWTTFGTLSLFESLLDGAFAWLPFYYLAKIVFLVWCFHPATKGAMIIYARVLQPLFGQLESRIEQVEKEIETKPPGGVGVRETSASRKSTSQKGR